MNRKLIEYQMGKHQPDHKSSRKSQCTNAIGTYIIADRRIPTNCSKS